MPLYEYHDEETGVLITLRRPVEERNKQIVLRRTKTVPDTLAVLSKEPTADQQQANSVMAGYRRQEQIHGSRMKLGGFTKDQIKKAWQEP